MPFIQIMLFKLIFLSREYTDVIGLMLFLILNKAAVDF